MSDLCIYDMIFQYIQLHYFLPTANQEKSNGEKSEEITQKAGAGSWQSRSSKM